MRTSGPRGAWPALLASAAALGAACSDDGQPGDDLHLPVAPSLRLTIDEDQPIMIRPLADVSASPEHPLTIVAADAGEQPVTIGDGGQSLELSPKPNFYGKLVIKYQVSAGGPARARGEITVIVNPVNDPPVAAAGELTVRRSAQLTLAGSDAENTPLRFEIVSPPQHGAVTTDESGLVYAPDAEFVGDDQLAYRANDGQLNSAPATVRLHVIADAAPVADPDTIATTEDQPAAITLRGADADDAALTFTVIAPPQHGVLSGAPPNLTYLPVHDYSGDDALTFVASDGRRTSAPATIAIRLAPVNDAPTALPQTAVANEDGSVTIALAGSDLDGDALSFQIERAPLRGTLSPVTGGAVTYTPAHDYNDSDSFSFRASDGQVTSQPATVTIQIAPVNDAPTALPQSAWTGEDDSVTIWLRGSDPDGDALSFAVAAAPAHGTLTGTPPFVTYHPDHDYNGPDTFTFTTADRTETSSPATVSLQIAPVNDAPVARDITVNLDEDTPVTIALPATDIDSSSLTYYIFTYPSDGLVTRSGGTLTYTPARNANGTRTLRFYAHDGQAYSNAATITFQITPVNDGPMTTDDYLATEPGAPVTFTVTGNDVDPEGDTFELYSVDAPGHGAIEMTGGTLTYTPQDGFTGIDVFGYTVVESHGAASTGQIHIGISAFPAGAPTETIATVLADPGDRFSAPTISADGRYIAFVTASALVPEDTNGLIDVYVYDRGRRTMARVSVASNGDQANAYCRHPRISANGRYVAFDSPASNLVAGDSNGTFDVFRHDRVTGETIRISAPATEPGQGGGTSPTISDDGNRVAFSSTAFDLIPNDVNGASDVFVRDITAGTTTRASASTTGSDGDLASSDAMISGDGLHVAFSSSATNLVAGDTNNVADVFVRDLAAGTTARASVSTTGGEADAPSDSPSLSRDGRFVSFVSAATNLVSPATTGYQVYVRDAQAPTTTRPTTSASVWARLSGDGRYLAEKTASGVLLIDRFAGRSISLSGTRTWTWPVLSSNGRYVVVVETLPQGDVVLTVAPNPFEP